MRNPRRITGSLLLITAVALALQATATSSAASSPSAAQAAAAPAVAGPTLAAPALAPPKTPVADSDALYTLCGRVFPDPQAFGPSPTAAAGESPYAKGNSACRATDYIQYGEAISGMRYLEKKFPRFVKVFDLRTDFPGVIDTAAGEGQSAGLPDTLLGRNKADLYLIRVTDGQVPNKDKKNFLFTLSLHGIEKAGLEGGLRAAEDLATWGSTSPNQPIMETLSTSLPVGQVLKKSVAWFAMVNPDGWRRGDTSTGGISYQRYNGNGVDLNRDWPDKGFMFKPYTPASEPESASFLKVLKHIAPKWAGGVDLHGQLIDRAFSFTLLGASQRPFDKNQRMLQFTRGAYQDAEKRLAWNPLIKPNSADPACVPPGTDGDTNPPPNCDPTPRVYGVQFGSIWDTIAYTVTGAIGNWGDSDLGLGADFIDNEMSLSHVANCVTGKCFIQSAEQLHVDGNKALVFGMLNYTLLPEDTHFRTVGRTAYLMTGKRLIDKGHGVKPPSTLPLQASLHTTLVKTPTSDVTYEFNVLPASAHKANQGLKAKATFSNVQGVGPGALLGIAIDVYNAKEPNPNGSPWTTVNQDYNQSPIYLQSGMQVDANDLNPGRYRVRILGTGAAAVDVTVNFTRGRAWPDPGQKPFNVSNTDFFAELVKFAPKNSLVPLLTSAVAAGKVDLQQFDTIVAADNTIGTDARVPAALKQFARKGGNVVLTDGAVTALASLGIVPADAIKEVNVYAGSVSFIPKAETGHPYGDPLAKDAHEPGAAEGPKHRKQTSEPVPTGYAVNTPDGDDAKSIPQFGVTAAAWAAANGRAVGTIGDSKGGEITYGEVALGAGRVRILGSLLPYPTTKFDHNFGLSSYAVTPTAYTLTRNLLSYLGPNRTAPSGTGSTPGTGGSNGGGNGGGLPTTGGLPLAGVAIALLALAALGVHHRRRKSLLG